MVADGTNTCSGCAGYLRSIYRTADGGTTWVDLFPTPSPGTTTAEVESNNSFATAHPMNIGDDKTGSVSPTNESDFFSFAGTAGQAVTISSTGLTLYIALYDPSFNF